MPLLSILSSAVPPPPRRAEVLAGLSRLLSRALQKPEGDVMVSIAQPLAMSFGGDATRPTCYAEVKNVGSLADERFEQLWALLSAGLAKALEVAPDRIYIEFTNADGALWAWNGTNRTTFG